MLSLVSKDLRETDRPIGPWKEQALNKLQVILWTTEKIKQTHPWDFVSAVELHSIITILINLQGAYFKVISSLFLFNLNDSQ